MKEVSAGIIIYRKDNEEIKFLLLYHGKGYWNFPKGKLEIEERSFRAALREVREETGLGPRDLRFKEWFKVYDKYIYQREGQKVFKTVIYYLAETARRDIRISSREHEGYGWFLYKEADRLLKHKNLKINLKRAYDLIRKKGSSGGFRYPQRGNPDLQASGSESRPSQSLESSR